MARPWNEYADLFNSFIKGRLRSSFNEMTGAGAITLETLTTYVTSGGADALTLADGDEGQLKIVVMAVDGGSSTITPVNFGGATSATVQLVAAGDVVGFQFLKGSWWMLWRTSTSATLPVVA